MRAAYVEEAGRLDKLIVGEQPTPEQTPGTVLVRVQATGVGPWDVKILLSGRLTRTPYIAGFEVAGIVEAAGDEAGVAVGDAVYASLFQDFAAGGLAEYAVMPMHRVARRSTKLSAEQAASLVVAAGTAYEGLIDRLHVQPGETVLITAAAGGVGTAAVQIAAGAGARVLGVASARNRDYLLGLGASDVFDYHDADWVEQVKATVPGGSDVLFDAAGGTTASQAVDALRPGGRAAFIVGAPATLDPSIQADAFAATVNRQRLDALTRLVDAGTLHAEIEETFPLEQARQALERVAGGHTRGKIVVAVG